jgi:hypothetical protein
LLDSRYQLTAILRLAPRRAIRALSTLNALRTISPRPSDGRWDPHCCVTFSSMPATRCWNWIAPHPAWHAVGEGLRQLARSLRPEGRGIC